MERLKNKSGITLIALVITILVLLILAGVTINIALGENGLFNQTKLAAEKYKNAQNMEEEQLQIAANAMMGDVPGNRDENEYVLKSQYDALLERVAALENNTNSQQSTTPTSINTNYSTSEQVVGTWINNKPLYQKTIVKSWAELVENNNSDYWQTDNVTNTYNHSALITGIQNASNARVVDFVIFGVNNYYNPLGDHTGNYSTSWNAMILNTNLETWITNDAKYIHLDWTEAKVLNEYNRLLKNENTRFIVTVQYTKTTD